MPDCVVVGLQVGSTGVTMRSQKEITLKNDLEARDRLDIYRNFLLYCMSGDVVALPMGSTGWALSVIMSPALVALSMGLAAILASSNQAGGLQEDCMPDIVSPWLTSCML